MYISHDGQEGIKQRYAKKHRYKSKSMVPVKKNVDEKKRYHPTQ